VHNCRQFLDRALAPEVMFPSPQWLKPSDFRILTAPLKRCSTLYTKCENALATIFGRTVSAVTFLGLLRGSGPRRQWRQRQSTCWCNFGARVGQLIRAEEAAEKRRSGSAGLQARVQTVYFYRVESASADDRLALGTFSAAGEAGKKHPHVVANCLRANCLRLAS
jgi:hypothetical protein